jgi:hypothetical protein
MARLSVSIIFCVCIINRIIQWLLCIAQHNALQTYLVDLAIVERISAGSVATPGPAEAKDLSRYFEALTWLTEVVTTPYQSCWGMKRSEWSLFLKYCRRNTSSFLVIFLKERQTSALQQHLFFCSVPSCKVQWEFDWSFAKHFVKWSVFLLWMCSNLCLYANFLTIDWEFH